MSRHKNIEDVLGRLREYHPEGKEECLFDNRYGHFAKDGREFVMTTPHTPGLWANFLTNGKYTAFITPTGGGYSWEGESGFNRVLREHPLNHLTGDTPGRYVYIKDTETNEFWSATYQPVKKSSGFEAVHSLGWSSSSNTYDNIYAQITYFVPMGTTHEIWKLKLINKSNKKRTLQLYTYAEFVLGSHQPDLMENSFNGLFNRGEHYHNSLLFTKTILRTRDNLVTSLYDKIGFFTSSEKFTKYELSRRDFIGFGYSLENPKLLAHNLPLTSKSKASENLISCISFEAVLDPGEQKEIYFALGTASQKKEIDTVTASLTKRNVDLQLKIVNSFWTNYINKVWIETPDTGLNIWFNYWLKYQAYFNAQWSEMDSFYIGGGGGFGFRDTAQHIWGVLPFEKDINIKHLTFLLSHQYPNGNVPHGVSIFTDEPSYSPHSDDPCWLVFAVLNYLEETGDYKFLDKVITYTNSSKYGSGHSGSVLNHIIRATDYSLRHMSERGIPQMRIADWNDALSTGELGKGESFLVAGLLGYNLKRFEVLLLAINRKDKANEYKYAYKRLKQSVENFGWDGDWFIRASEDHQKAPVGSKSNERAKIFLDSNTWLCFSGIAGDRAKKTLESLWKYLMTPYGAMLFTPAYKKEDIERGIISQFTEGAKENAAIFLHANAWFLIALAKAGESKKALDLLQIINPVHSCVRNADIYKVEPYVLAEFIFGEESDKFGEGSFTWVTGSAEWFLRGILDYFLGLRPDYDKLVFEPKVPKDWVFSVEREFQGKRFRAEYKKGKKSLKVIK